MLRNVSIEQRHSLEPVAGTPEPANEGLEEGRHDRLDYEPPDRSHWDCGPCGVGCGGGRDRLCSLTGPAGGVFISDSIALHVSVDVSNAVANPFTAVLTNAFTCADPVTSADAKRLGFTSFVADTERRPDCFADPVSDTIGHTDRFIR